MTSSMSTAYTCYHKQINIKQIHISDCLNRRRLSQIHRAWKKNALANNDIKLGLSDLQTYTNQTHFYITLSFLVWKLW